MAPFVLGANAVLGGWRLGLLQTAESGPTFTVITSANTTNAFPAGALRPDLVRNPVLPSGGRTLDRWFDTGAFVGGERTISIPPDAPPGTVVPYYCAVHKGSMRTPNGEIRIVAPR